MADSLLHALSAIPRWPFDARTRAAAGLVAALVLFPPARAAQLTLFDGTAPAVVVYAADGGVPIAKAAELLGHDLHSLTGSGPVVTPAFDRVRGAAVIVGRLDSPAIAAILQTNHISTAEITGKWETYGRAVVPAPWDSNAQALVIFGSDTRGTV